MRIQLVAHERVGIEEGGDHGGVGISQRMIARGLAGRGHEVELLVMSEREFARETEGYSYRGWRPAVGRLAFLRNLRRQAALARRFADGRRDTVTVIPDVCAVSWPYPLVSRKVIKFTCTHLLQKYEAAFEDKALQEAIVRKTVVISRSVPKYKRPRPGTAIAERIMVPRADAYMAISRRTAEVSSMLFRIPLDAITVIPNAVDTRHFRPDTGTQRESKLLLYVGTVCGKKGALDAVEALSMLVQVDPEFRMVMIGRDGVDNTGRPNMKAQIADRFGDLVGTHLQFIEHVTNSELPGYYRRASIVVLPSHYESFGRTTIEAMACGAPVIRTEAPPADEIIEDQISGLLCKTKSPEDIARTVLLLARSPEVRVAMGAAARSRVERLYSIESVAESTERFLTRVVSGTAK